MLLSLGNFKFAVDSTAYNELDRSADYPWSKVERLGGTPQFQAIGKEHRTVSIKGTVFPTYSNVGKNQIETLREMAAEMKPLHMVAGDGTILGKWVILGIEESKSAHFEDGVPRKQEFSMSLERFSDE